MNKNLTEIVFILDRSGSMGGLEADTIGGFNAFLEKQKKEEGEALLSTILFDHESVVLYDRVDIRKVEPMTERQYQVRGSTALLDAIGGAVHHMANVHKYAREEDRPGKTAQGLKPCLFALLPGQAGSLPLAPPGLSVERSWKQ